MPLLIKFLISNRTGSAQFAVLLKEGAVGDQLSEDGFTFTNRVMLAMAATVQDRKA